MPSQLAWLDTSAEEQRQVRELIRLYSQPESRDELGYGPVRDVLSEALFPGTSVLQTRARYFLFVPWSYREAARTRSGEQLQRLADHEQRQLITTLKGVPELAQGAGLIGARAGAAVKILPSAIFWPALSHYGILTGDVAPDQLGSLRSSQVEDELAERVATDWHPTLPSRPAGFPREVAGGFDLTPDEASWLRERILSATSGTLLERVLLSDEEPVPDNVFPWLDPICLKADPEPAAWLAHARSFSTAMRGAALVYNLLLAELSLARGYGDEGRAPEGYREALTSWETEVESQQDSLASWDRQDFWLRVLRANPRISKNTQEFVREWTAAVASGRAHGAADDRDLRDRVRNQERRAKRKQSRFDNDRLLRGWTGRAGTGAMTFRWPNVRNIVTDIYDGHRRADT